MWLAAGWVAFSLGIIGLALPVMPTVPFLLLAAYCFEKGSPRLHGWLMNHPRFGPPIEDWQRHRVIRWPAKILAVACMSGSLAYVWIYRDVAVIMKVSIGAIMFVAAIYIVTRKSERDSDG